MNKLNFNFEVKAKKNGSIVVAGFANAATIDRAEEIIDPKAWRLDNYKKNPIVLFDHGMDLAFGSLPVGKAIKVEPKENGLYCEVEISNSKTEKITAVRDLVEEGILKTFSVGFDPKNSAKEENIKRITDAELLEISFVPIPMNQDSTFSMLSKSLSDQRTKTARRWWDNYKKNVQREIVSAVKNNAACDKLELLSLVVEKDGFDSLEKAKKFLVEKKYLVEKIDEDDNCWKFIQKHADNVETIEIDLTPSIKAVIKGKKMDQEEQKPDENEEEQKPDENQGESSEEETQKADGEMMQKEDVESAIAEMQAEASACANNEEGNPASWVGNEAAWSKAKEAADQGYSREDPEKYWAVVTWLYLNRFGGTVKQQEKSDENSDSKSANDPETKNVIATGGDAVQETVNPQIDLSKQTNVLLGVVIDQLQKLNMSMEKMVDVPRRVDDEPEQQQETEQENRQENRQQETEEEDDEEMKKAISRIRANQEDLNLRLKSLIY